LSIFLLLIAWLFTLSPTQRSQRASIAALTRWSREDPAANAARGQAGLREKFRREALAADPQVVEPELTRRAEAARRAHMKRLSFRRSKRTGRTPGGEAA
jgi:hypothetical protein